MLSTLVVIPALLVACGALLAYGSVRLQPGSGERVRRRELTTPLAHELPYWSLGDDGIIIGTDLSYSAALELQGLDTDCRSDEDMQQLAVSLHSVFHVLPAGATLQFIHDAGHDHEARLLAYTQHNTAMDPVARRLVADKVASLRQATHLRQSRLVLICTTPNPFQGAAARAGMPKRFGAVTTQQHAEELQRVRTLRAQLSRGLASAGIRSTALDGELVRSLIYQHLNPRRSATVPAPTSQSTPAWAEEQTAREQLCFSCVRENRAELHLDGQRLRVLSLRSLPQVTVPAFLEGLTVRLGFACRVSLAVEVMDDQRVLDQLKRKRDRAQAHATLGERRNQEAEAQVRDVEELIDQQLYSSMRLVRLSLTVVLSVPDNERASEALDAQSAEVLRLFSSLHGAEALVEEYAQLDSWLHALPGNARHGGRWHTCTSENGAQMALVWQSWPGHETPAVLVENGRNYLVGLDPFAPDLDNPNAFMAGASGAGKSVTTNYLLMHLLAGGTKALVIDVGGSYRQLIELFGGEYLSFEAESDPALNLFYAAADIRTEDGTLEPLRLQFVRAVLESLLSSGDRELRNEERAVLDVAIRRLYDTVDTPILGDLVRVLQIGNFADEDDNQIARRLAKGLGYWAFGAHGRLLNRPSTIRLTSDLAAFDLKGLADDVRGPVVLILSAIIWNLVTRDPSEKNMVVFDEVWSLLSSPAASKLLEELYRTSRKYRCSILSISQSVEDFTNSPIASALVNNSATAYLLRHRHGHQLIADQFQLNERECAVFRELEMRRGEYSEVLMLSGNEHHFVARIALTPLEYWIATTHPADRKALAGIRRAHPHLTLLDALELCAAHWPQGAPENANV